MNLSRPCRCAGLLLWLIAGRPGPGNAAAPFPIGVWLQNPTNAAAYRAAGINTYVGLWKGPTAPQLTALLGSGLQVICTQNDLALRHPYATNIIAWMHNDEPDNATTRGARFGFGSPVAPEKIQADYRQMKKTDPTRPVFLNLGQGVAWDGWYGRGNRNQHPEDYPEYLKGCDLVAFDIYPANHASPEVAGHLWYVARGVERLRHWSQDAKPVWSCIETTRISKSGRRPTPQEVRAEVWLALIHGAQGLVYFVHQFAPNPSDAALLKDKAMLAAVTALNQQIAELTPVLRSPTRPSFAPIQSTNAAVPVAGVVKHHGGFTYLFAVAMRADTTAANFALKNLPGEKTVTVLGENRILPMKDGDFSDAFGPWDVHLYRVESGAAR